MRSPWKLWEEFLFSPHRARVLGLYRIGLGLIVIYNFALLAQDATVFFSDQGLLSSPSSAEAYGPNYLTIFDWIRGPQGVRAALVGLFISAASFTIGFKTRWSAVALFVLVVSFQVRNSFLLQGGDGVLRTMLFFFMFAPAGAAFSVDSVLRHLRSSGTPPEEPKPWPWAQRMMQIQVAIIYAVAAYGKLLGDRYWDGTAMYYVLGRLDIHLAGLEGLMNYPAIYKTLTVAMIAMELPLPLLFWFRKTRPYAVVLGVALHAWIIVFIVIPVFGIVMITSYLVFFDERELDGVIERMRRRVAPRRARVYLDPASRTGRLWARLVPILDALGRVVIETGPSLGKEGAPVSPVLLITAQGKEKQGIWAALWLAPRLLGVFWAIPALYVPWRARALPEVGEAPSPVR